MRVELDRLIARDWPRLERSSPLLIYGAGNAGRAVFDFLAAAGYRVEAFLDANATSGQHWKGVPVLRLAQWLASNTPGSFEVVVAIHNYTVDMAPLLSELRKVGFARVMNMVEFQNGFPQDRTFRYWLAPASDYRPHLARIEALLEVLGDDRSRQWVSSVLEFRLSGDYACLPAPSPADAYFPQDLPRWADPIRFVDCGAYTGDTIERLAQSGGYRFEAIVAFEPDPSNYAQLARNAARWGPAVCLPCAVGASTARIGFASGLGTGSRASEIGDLQVQCVAIDEALGGFRPTLIKMDIEGAELDALSGARRTIAESRPALAICLYHQAAHLWEIPLLVHSWDLGYDLFVRCHAHGSFELVLYAVPKEAPAIRTAGNAQGMIRA